MGKRRRAREVALQILYLMDTQPQPTERALTSYFSFFASLEAGSGAIDTEVRSFAEELVRGVADKRAEVDEEITRAALHWRLERMACVDRNVLRLAVYELLFLPKIPPRVSLNEAIELAKRFGTADSPSFVNGILDRVVQEKKLTSNRP